MATTRQIEANRRNALKSTGPRTEAGKRRSRRNALKHGLCASGEVLHDDDNRAMAGALADWETHFEPTDPVSRALVRRGALSAVRLERCAREEQARLDRRTRHALSRWRLDRREQVETLVARLPVDPCRVAPALRESAEGCDWLMARWRLLRIALKGRGYWTLDELTQSLHLLGRSEQPHRIELSVCQWTAAHLAAQSDRSESAAAAEGLMSAEQGREWLRVESLRELRNLRKRRDTFRIDRDHDRTLAVDRALFDPSDEAALMRRYETAAMTDINRCIGLLSKLPHREAARPRSENSAPTPLVEAPRSRRKKPRSAPSATVEPPRPTLASETVETPLKVDRPSRRRGVKSGSIVLAFLVGMVGSSAAWSIRGALESGNPRLWLPESGSKALELTPAWVDLTDHRAWSGSGVSWQSGGSRKSSRIDDKDNRDDGRVGPGWSRREPMKAPGRVAEMMRHYSRIAGTALAIAFVTSSARGQAPTIDTSSSSSSTGGSLFDNIPGAGGGSFNNLPGAGGGILTGRVGVGGSRAPASVSLPSTAGGVPNPSSIRPIAILAENPLPNYGSLSIPAGGEDEGPADGMDLNQLVERVVAYNIDLRAKFYEIPQAQADILTASLRANPVFYADSQLIPYSQFSRSRPGGPTQYDINISFPLDVNRKRLARIAVASRAKRVLEALFQDAIRTQIDNLYTAYVDVLAARLTLDYARASLKGLDEALGYTVNKFERGVLVEAEVQQIRVPREFAAGSLADAEGSYRRSLQTMAVLLNIPPQEAESLKIRGSIREPKPQEFAEENLAKMALMIRPDVIANRLGVQRAMADVELARKNRFADVYLLAQPYTFQDNAPFGTKSAHSAAVGLTVPLPLINRNQGNIQRARLNVDQTKIELSSVERQAYLDVQQALIEYQVSLEGVRRAELSRNDAEKVFKRTETLWKAGQIEVLIYLASRREYNDTVRQYRDLNVRHRRSMLNLNTAVGKRILE